MTEHTVIKCGNCGSEYAPRVTESEGVDNSCPVCGHGKRNLKELQDRISTNKQILKD